jgi:hypothetical protein
MAQTLDIARYEVGRQDPIVAKAAITFGTALDGDAAVTGTYRCIAVPAGAIVVGGFLAVTGATTATVDLHVGDGLDDNRYADNVDGGAAGTTVLTRTGYEYTTDDTIDIMIDTAAPAASGGAILVVEYIVDGRSAFVQK